MGKVKKSLSIHNFILPTFFLVILFFGGNWSCKNAKLAEHERLDSLASKLEKIEHNLSFSLKTINNRKLEIFEHMNLIKRYDKKEMDLAFSNQVAQYQSIGKLYKSYVNGYESMFNQRRELLDELEILREGVGKGLSRKLFKVEYFKLKAEINKVEKRTSFFYNRINELEPAYQRLSNTIERYITNMRMP